MPYLHRECGGEIRWFPPLPIPPKCKKCEKKWSILVIYGKPPKDMVFSIPKPKIPEIRKGKTKYSSWGDNVPYVGTVASWFPNWPRWLRRLVFAIVLGIVIVVISLILR